jgi:cytochrome c-type biogenesis protein CcmH
MGTFKRFVMILAVAAVCAGASDPRIRKLEERFITPCCWSEPVSVHRSPLAEEMRGEIGAMVAAGKSDEEIVAHYVGKYGERVLVVPRGQRSFWLTITPFVCLALAGAWLIRYLFRKRDSEPPAQMAAAAPVRDEDLDW